MIWVCIEIDVLQARHERIWVGWGDHSQTVEVIYEKVSHFSSHCKLLGNFLEFCSRHGSSRPRGFPLKGKTPQPVPSDDQLGNSDPLIHVSPSGRAPKTTGPGWTQKQGRPRAALQTAPIVNQSSNNPFEVFQTLQDDACQGKSPAVGVTLVSDIS